VQSLRESVTLDRIKSRFETFCEVISKDYIIFIYGIYELIYLSDLMNMT